MQEEVEMVQISDEDQKIIQEINLLRAELKSYKIGSYMLKGADGVTIPDRVNIGLFGIAGTGKSNLVNLMIATARDQHKVEEYSKVSHTASHGTRYYDCFPLLEDQTINLYDTIGLNVLGNDEHDEIINFANGNKIKRRLQKDDTSEGTPRMPRKVCNQIRSTSSSSAYLHALIIVIDLLTPQSALKALMDLLTKLDSNGFAYYVVFTKADKAEPSSTSTPSTPPTSPSTTPSTLYAYEYMGLSQDRYTILRYDPKRYPIGSSEWKKYTQLPCLQLTLATIKLAERFGYKYGPPSQLSVLKKNVKQCGDVIIPLSSSGPINYVAFLTYIGLVWLAILSLIICWY